MADQNKILTKPICTGCRTNILKKNHWHRNLLTNCIKKRVFNWTNYYKYHKNVLILSIVHDNILICLHLNWYLDSTN